MDKLLESMLPKEIYMHFDFITLNEYEDRYEMKLNLSENSDKFGYPR